MHRLLLVLVLGGCAHAPVQRGVASWYGPGLWGNDTASGEPLRRCRRTAAHRTLPFGTVLRVEDPASGRAVRVVVNDRGPFVAGRDLDLSRKAARRLDMVERGVIPVEYRVVGHRRRYDR